VNCAIRKHPLKQPYGSNGTTLEFTMISINSFFPLDNFTRQVYEFFDEKVLIKTKSLTIETEHETKYEKIKVIQRKKYTDLRWFGITFFIITIIGVLHAILNWTCQSNPTIYFIEKLGAVLGLLLCIPVLHKIELCSFLDADRNYLANIRVNNHNRKLLEDAIKLIKQKSEIFSETNLADPLAGTPQIFEITQWDISDFLNKSVARFYEDRLVDSEKSLIEELVTEVKYCELSGKTQSIKVGNVCWSSLGWFWLFLSSTTFFLIDIFSPQQTNGVAFYLFWGGTIPSILMFILRYIKRETLLLKNKNNEVVWWARSNLTNRKKLEQIVEFIQNKTASNSEN
jgi:hypothetical protein